MPASLELEQLIWINIDGDGDVFGHWQFVDGVANQAAQTHDGLAANQNMETKLTL